MNDRERRLAQMDIYPVRLKAGDNTLLVRAREENIGMRNGSWIQLQGKMLEDQ